MPDITKTEATLMDVGSYSREARITVLAGMVGEERLRFYNNLPVYANLPIQARPYLGVGLRTSRTGYSGFNNMLCVTSTMVLCPLYRGDTMTFYFEDGNSIKVHFIVGNMKWGNEKLTFTPITDHQLAYFTEQHIKSIEVYNHKAMIPFSFEPTEDPNEQYTSASEAKKLLKIMAERIIGCKALLVAGE